MKSLLERIERLPLLSLMQYPGNPNVGDVDVIAESLEENSQFLPVIVQKSTGYILSGNHTVIAAARLGWTEIDAAVVDVEDAQALKILLAANRTRDKAKTDRDKLAELLSYLDDDYTGTGYSDFDVNLLIEESALDPRGMVTVDEDLMSLASASPATQQRGHLCPKCGYDTRADPEGLR